jgi:NADPH:quinone reductase-like Zn-dependent oxidoreductase
MAEVRRLTDGEGVDVVMDAMGPASFRKDYRILRPGGRLILYGLSDAVNEDGRNLRSVVTSLLRLPTSTHAGIGYPQSFVRIPCRFRRSLGQRENR